MSVDLMKIREENDSIFVTFPVLIILALQPLGGCFGAHGDKVEEMGDAIPSYTWEKIQP
jgi:hypothetical protein